MQSVRDIDKEIWRKFVAYCKLKDVKVGDKINDILNEHLNKNFKIK